MNITPGAIRLLSPIGNVLCLTGYDVRIEVQQTDGTWLPLHCVTAATITIRPDGPVSAALTVLVTECDIDWLAPAEVAFVRHHFPTRRWRLLNWWQRMRRWVGMR